MFTRLLPQFSLFSLVLRTNYLTIFLIASSQSLTTRPLLTSSLIDIKSRTLVTPAKSPSPYSQADTHFYNPHLLESWNNKEKDVVTGTWCRSLLTLEACYSLSTLAAMRIDIWPDSTPNQTSLTWIVIVIRLQADDNTLALCNAE